MQDIRCENVAVSPDAQCEVVEIQEASVKTAFMIHLGACRSMDPRQAHPEQADAERLSQQRPMPTFPPSYIPTFLHSQIPAPGNPKNDILKKFILIFDKC